MSGNRTPGPWVVVKLSREQPRPYFVCRDVSAPGFTHFEQMRDPSGSCARFDSEAEAEAAAKIVNNSLAFC